MADSPYLPSRPTAKDRVRGLSGDKAVPFKLQDDEIAYELGQTGFVGDPLAESPSQPLPEIDAAIALLETAVVVSASETSLKLGDDTYTTKGMQSGGFEKILANLKNRRLNLLGVGSGIAVVQCDYPELDARNGYPDSSGGCW